MELKTQQIFLQLIERKAYVRNKRKEGNKIKGVTNSSKSGQSIIDINRYTSIQKEEPEFDQYQEGDAHKVSVLLAYSRTENTRN